MKLSIIVDDNLIIKDGIHATVDMASIPFNISNLWAIHWNETAGEMELRDGQANVPFTDFTSIQPFADAFDTEYAVLTAPLPLDEYKALKVIEISNAAGAQITTGFTSDALGTTHTYGGKSTDQLNLIGAVSSGVDMPFPCADAGGVWDRRVHTNAQLKQALVDGSVYKQTVLVALDARRVEIDGAVDHAAVDAVAWVGV